MKKLALFLIGIFLFTFLGAQQVSPPQQQKNDKTFKHALGFAAGFTSGYGLSYRFMPKKVGVQITVAPFSSEDITQYSLGFAVLGKLAETRVSDFFIYGSTHYFYREKHHDSWNLNEPIKRQINTGLGIGIEFKAGDRVIIDLMTGYGGYDGFKRFNMTGEMGIYFKL